MKKDLYIIIGETATGKTSLSIDIANKKSQQYNPNLSIEIINADQTQFYKELNYGVCKINKSEKQNIKHHLLNHLSLYNQKDLNYNVNNFIIDCEQKITEIINKNKTPLIVGGSHYYIYKLLYNNYKDNETKNNIKNKEDNKKYNKIDGNKTQKSYNTNFPLSPIKTNQLYIKNKKYLQKLKIKYNFLRLYTFLKLLILFQFKYLQKIPYPLQVNNSDINNLYRLESFIKILKDNYIYKLRNNFFNLKPSNLWDKYNIIIIYTQKYNDLIVNDGVKYKKLLKSRWESDLNNIENNNLYRAFLEYTYLKSTIDIEVLTKKALVFDVFKKLNINNKDDFYKKYDKILIDIIDQDYKYSKRQNVYIKKYFKQYLDQ